MFITLNCAREVSFVINYSRCQHLQIVNTACSVCLFWLTYLFVPICSTQGFVSPADRTYDALGLVKQISKQSAAAAVEACEVLASGSRIFDKENKENRDDKEPGTRKSQTKIMVRNHQRLNSKLTIMKHSL